MSEVLSYDDYKKEIINGKVYYMSPGTSIHVRVISRLAYEFQHFLRTKKRECEVLTEGLEVYLNADNSEEFVIPDISVVCDKSRFIRRGYQGPPELIVEVMSASTAKKDKGVKFSLYEKSGVKEYWIVDTKSKLIDEYILNNDKYVLKDTITLIEESEMNRMTKEEKEMYSPIIESFVFEGLKIDLNEIFDQYC